jgi:hypothetical protein
MNKRGYGSLIWGGMLILLGLLLLLENLNVFGEWQAPFWSLFLGAFGLLFLSIYVRDREQWWALIPALVILGIAVAVFLAEQDLIAGYLVATIILAAVGLPFLLIFVTDRGHWWALIPALTMLGVAAGVFLEGVGAIGGTAVAGFVLGGISLGFLSIYLIDREQWWALIPGGIMGIMAFFFLLATATKYIWPLAIILLGLLLLRGSLGGGRRRPSGRRRVELSVPPPSTDASAPQLQRQRLPTLEEQIEAAIAEESAPAEGAAAAEPEGDAFERPAAMPPAPEMPQPPEVPPGPQ